MKILINALGRFVISTVLMLVVIGILLETAIGKALLFIVAAFIFIALANSFLRFLGNARDTLGPKDDFQEFQDYPQGYDTHEVNGYPIEDYNYNPDYDFGPQTTRPKPYIREPKRPQL